MRATGQEEGVMRALSLLRGAYASGFLEPEQSAWAVDRGAGHLPGHHNTVEQLQ